VVVVDVFIVKTVGIYAYSKFPISTPTLEPESRAQLEIKPQSQYQPNYRIQNFNQSPTSSDQTTQPLI